MTPINIFKLSQFGLVWAQFYSVKFRHRITWLGLGQHPLQSVRQEYVIQLDFQNKAGKLLIFYDTLWLMDCYLCSQMVMDWFN